MTRFEQVRRMSPLFALLVVGLVTSSAQGQAFVTSDIVGNPLAMIDTPVLYAGSCYEIQTVNLSETADPIISIRTGGTDLDTTLAGADGCGGDLVPACARFCPTGTTVYTVWVRGFNTASRGRVDLRIQTVGAIGDPINVDCGPGIPLPCWSTFGDDVSFGGVIATGISTGSPSVFQIETAELPGMPLGAASSHIVVFAGDNNDPDINWKIVPSGHPALLGSGFAGSHRNNLGDTAQYSGPTPPATPGNWNVLTAIAGPSRRRDRFG